MHSPHRCLFNSQTQRFAASIFSASTRPDDPRATHAQAYGVRGTHPLCPGGFRPEELRRALHAQAERFIDDEMRWSCLLRRSQPWAPSMALASRPSKLLKPGTDDCEGHLIRGPQHVCLWPWPQQVHRGGGVGNAHRADRRRCFVRSSREHASGLRLLEHTSLTVTDAVRCTSPLWCGGVLGYLTFRQQALQQLVEDRRYWNG